MEKKVEKQMPSNELKITIGPNQYTIKFPNNGKLIDIEVRKLSITNGMHKDLLFGASSASRDAYLAVEAGCTFEILIPELSKDLNVKSLFELNPFQSRDITQAYQKYYDWMELWRVALSDEVVEEVEKKDDK